jgi:hypothetical protein
MPVRNASVCAPRPRMPEAGNHQVRSKRDACPCIDSHNLAVEGMAAFAFTAAIFKSVFACVARKCWFGQVPPDFDWWWLPETPTAIRGQEPFRIVVTPSLAWHFPPVKRKWQPQRSLSHAVPRSRPRCVTLIATRTV